MTLRRKQHRETLAAIFAEPTRGSIPWKDVSSLLVALGAKKKEGKGSRVRFSLNGRLVIVHRPHPQKECGKGLVEDLRDFLIGAGIEPS